MVGAAAEADFGLEAGGGQRQAAEGPRRFDGCGADGAARQPHVALRRAPHGARKFHDLGAT